ncbi:hypothetical protein DTI05_08915, partial [Campylobacter coli]|nr:hypothetical protein [Campylobacter coli]
VFIFSIILYFIFKVFFKIKNKTKTINFKTIFKKFTLFLLPVYLLLFLVGGCSYKYMDPQYYEFKKLCKDNSNKMIVFNKDYLDLKKQFIQAMMNNSNIRIKNNGIKYFYNEKLNLEIQPSNWKEIETKSREIKLGIGKVKEKEIEAWYIDDKNNIKYQEFKRYLYYNYNIFLRGDEGAGFHFEYEEILDCEDVR